MYSISDEYVLSYAVCESWASTVFQMLKTSFMWQQMPRQLLLNRERGQRTGDATGAAESLASTDMRARRGMEIIDTDTYYSRAQRTLYMFHM
jgi:hypothetical protein